MDAKINTQEIEKKQFYLLKGISLVDKYDFYEYLAVMIDGGVSISDALESVQEKIDSPFFKERLNELATYIESGDSFSKSMKKLPDVFNASEISVVEAGEQTGTLVESLQKISDDMKKIYLLKKKVTGALTYPSIIFLFLMVAILVVLIYVIPAIEPLFITSGVEYPLATKALVVTSEFIRNNFAVLILLIASVIVFFISYSHTESGKISIEKFILGLPLVGKVYRNYILSNLVSTLGVLVGSGINVIKTLQLVGKATNNSIYDSLLIEVASRVSKGDKIVDSMRAVDPGKYYFPSDFLQMLSVGEKTATLDKMSYKISMRYEQEVDSALGNLTKWIEPLAIAIAGIFVLWFAFAIFGAILKVTQVVGG